MFGYPYAYSRPQSYYPSTAGYPYNYGGRPQRPRSFFDYANDDSDYADEYKRRLALAEQKRRIELEMMREEEERRRREAYRRAFGYPTSELRHADESEKESNSQTQRLSVPIKSRSPSPPPAAADRKSIPIEEPAVKPPTPAPAAPEADSYLAGVDKEKLDQAASAIQAAYRRHRALATILSKQARFQKLCNEFKMPERLDYEYAGRISLSVMPEEAKEGEEVEKPAAAATAKLGYTPNNAPLHGHIEQLNQLLIALDGIESLGDPNVRKKRKEVVKNIEGEVERVEGLWRAAWERYSS